MHTEWYLIRILSGSSSFGNLYQIVASSPSEVAANRQLELTQAQVPVDGAHFTYKIWEGPATANIEQIKNMFRDEHDPDHRKKKVRFEEAEEYYHEFEKERTFE